MSKFLINHFARSVIKATNSQPRAKASQPGSEQDTGTIEWKALGIGFLIITIITALIILFIIVVMAFV